MRIYHMLASQHVNVKWDIVVDKEAWNNPERTQPRMECLFSLLRQILPTDKSGGLRLTLCQNISLCNNIATPCEILSVKGLTVHSLIDAGSTKEERIAIKEKEAAIIPT